MISEAGGIEANIINYGAAVTNLIVPDKEGGLSDIILGFDSLEGYIQGASAYIGTVCGRCANRIAQGLFSIDGTIYNVSKNEGEHCLHGGFNGFDKVFWEVDVLPSNDGVTFSYTSKDGEEGFPGKLEVSVTYRVSNNSLHITYLAQTDKATPVNLTSHCYFNLSGGKEMTIQNHELQLMANEYIEVNKELIPTGKLIPVKNTTMDFLTFRKLGRVGEEFKGYDHCWVLKGESGMKKAILLHRESGRMMNVFTTQPGIQLYTGNSLDGRLRETKNDAKYMKHAAVCLEAQHFPDSPNHAQFPDTILHPEKEYKQETIYQFEIFNP